MNVKAKCWRCGKEYLLQDLRYSKHDKKYYCSVKSCGSKKFELIKRR